MNLLGKVEELVDIQNLKIPQTLRVCNNLTENLILGRAFLEESGANIDFNSKIVTFCNDVVQIPLQHLIDNRTVARICNPTFVPPRSEIVVPVTCNRIFNNKEVILKAIEGQQFSQFALANAIVAVRNERTVCRLMNFQDKPLVLSPGQKIGQLEMFDKNLCLAVSDTPENKEEQVPTMSREALLEFGKEYNFQINKELPEEIRLELLAVLHKRKKAFSRNTDEISCYNKEEFEIKLKQGFRPSFQRQFRHKPEHAKFLQEHIDHWLKAGIVEPCFDYEWNNSIFLVPKGDLSNKTDKLTYLDFRPCLDLRLCNEQVEKFIFYNPPTKEILEEITRFTVAENGKLERPTYFTGVDLNQAFMQIKVQPQSRKIHSFISPQGQKLTFTRIPYGNRVSPAIFSTIINRLFSPMRSKGGLTYYLDDLLIFSTSPSQHIKQIDQVLEILIENNLTCSTKKTLLMQSSIKHLGVIINSEGISVPESLNSVLDKLAVKPIKTVKQLQSLLGMLNFWRNFIKNFALRSGNLRRLTQKGVKFDFDDKCKEEQRDLINALRHAPTLSPVNPNKSIWLLVDSSKDGIGYSVCQSLADVEDEKQVAKELAQLRKGETTLKPIFFYSYATSKQTKLYGSTALELHGLGRAIQSLEYLTQNRLIRVVTDNVGVSSLQTLRGGNGRERRLLAYLMQFNLKFHYLQGAQHASSDYLSRWMADCDEKELAELIEPPEDVIDDILFNISHEKTQQVSDNEKDSHVGEWMLYSLTNKRNEETKNNEPQIEDSEVNNITDQLQSQENVGLRSENENEIPKEVTFRVFDENVQAITLQDYIDDESLGPITQYLMTDALTGIKAVDYKTLIASPLYVIENEKLYRHELPKNKKRSAETQPEKLLVLPLKWQNEFITKLHKTYGHFAAKKLYGMARSLFYFKELFNACGEVANSCPDCQFSKINRRKIVPPLVPTPRFKPNSVFYLDFKKLARTTEEGFKHILVMMEAYSNYPYYELTKTTTAVETAQAIIKRLIGDFGTLPGFVTDKGSNFTSSIFKTLTRDILGTKHWMSASRQPISHGLVEQQIAQLSKAITLYCSSDLEIPQALPLLELHARISVQNGLGFSPFEILKGYQPSMNLPEIDETELKAPVKSHEEYITWLKDRLARIRNDVDKNIAISRAAQKRSYDKRMNVKEPDFKEGMTVLLHTGNPRPHSDQILCHRKFGSKKYFITKVVSKENEFAPTEEDRYPTLGQAAIAPSYQLCDTKTGKLLKFLVPAFRLKKFIEKEDFNKKFPPLEPPINASEPKAKDTPQPSQDQVSQSNANDQLNNDDPSNQWFPAKSISRKRMQNKQLQFLVRWEDGSQSWQSENDVTPLLKQKFFIKLANKNRERQRQARKRFN